MLGVMQSPFGPVSGQPVPRDYTQFLKIGSLNGARIGIVPERTGHGFKHKVLDYVFNRIPVAAIENSVSGMPLAAGESILVYPNMVALCTGVLALLDDVERLNRLQESAFKRCSGRFEWQSRGRDLLGEVERLMALGHAGRDRTRPALQ